jgi:CubicO group peptidase (beta-lactamase class C family)
MRIAIFICTSILSLVLMSSCKVGRFVVYNFANITDHKIFPSRALTASSTPHKYVAGNENALSNIKQTLDEQLPRHKTVAFLIIRNDSMLYENYFNNYQQDDVVASFSMAKSVTGILIGCAIADGLIKSEQDLVIDYLPQLKDNGFEKVSINHLLQMTSGLKFSETYISPFSHAAGFYYGTQVTKMSNRLKLKREPGTKWEYNSGTTQLLGLVLQSALKGKSVTQYLQEKLWTPLQMEYNASWSLDHKNGTEKTFCCLNARARDFAKIGSLYLHTGNWNGQQIVPAAWVAKANTIDTSNGGAPWYQCQWWLPNKKGDFMADGYRGQYIFVCPRKNLVIVRLGKNTGNINWGAYFTSLADKL